MTWAPSGPSNSQPGSRPSFPQSARAVSHDQFGVQVVQVPLEPCPRSTVSNGMNAPTRNGIDVPKWRR